MRNHLFSCPLGIVLALASCLLPACTRENQDAKAPREDPSAAAPEEVHQRLALTRDLIEDHRLTSADLSELQLYLHGRIVLRRGTEAGARQITKQHTLRVVDGRTVDEVVVESGTPGVNIAEDAMRVNFDPEAPETGLEFEADDVGRLRLRTEARRGERAQFVEYGGERYELAEGARAYLEIEAEKLRDHVLRQRKLPGTLLPGTPASGAPLPTAPP